ncbi:DUF748 domain-containing protein [Sediminicola luteus]|uniref:DUF748 domain-containing protein n=1 Tax=Sediminicola luteus TaxID=319238 RepID=A0A2A4GB08_9FLAO|nr:DUF748 domain-containing protein [Sediminicola luteus]PCE65787.1 hypothetical protein B7P33_00325 [Sediminicola luteus]
MGRFGKRTKIVLLSLLGVVVLILLVLPSAIRYYAVKNSPELLGRQIALEKLKYNYFTSTARAYGFVMYEADGEKPFVSFDTLMLDLAPLNLFKDKLVVEGFYLQGLDATVVMQDSTFNFDDLIRFHSTAETTDTVGASTEPFKYSLTDLRLQQANFHFVNQNIEHTTTLEDISFAVPFVGWDQNEKSEAAIRFDLKKGGHIQSVFKLDPNSGDYDAFFDVAGLHLNPFYKYVRPYAEINTLEGTVGAQLDLIGNLNSTDLPVLTGKVDVADFEMTDTADKIFLGSKHLRASLKEIDMNANRYHLDSVQVNDSYTYFQLDSLSNNFFRIFKLEESAATPETDANTAVVQASEATSLQYVIDHLALKGGVLDYTDNLTGSPFNYHLSEMALTADAITSEADWVELYATMVLNNRGDLVAKVGLNPNDYVRNLDYDIAIKKFLLPDLNIYTNYYMGHSLLEGDMYYNSKSKITDGQLEIENKLLVKNASLKTTKGGLYNLPLKFAFFLLTDKNGDINLDVPVRGDLDDPSINVGKLVWTTFKNVITKTVAAPVNFLVGLVGGDPGDISEIKFDYLDSIPTPKHYRQLDKLLQLEEKKPGLAIEMQYFVDQELQREALARAVVGADFKKQTDKDYQKKTAEFEAFVNEHIGHDSFNLTQAVLVLAGPERMDSIAHAYSDKRIQQLGDYLKMHNDSTHITIKPGDPKEPAHTGAQPLFKVVYDLEGEVSGE